jgi:hypothetical protein
MKRFCIHVMHRQDVRRSIKYSGPKKKTESEFLSGTAVPATFKKPLGHAFSLR